MLFFWTEWSVIYNGDNKGLIELNEKNIRLSDNGIFRCLRLLLSKINKLGVKLFIIIWRSHLFCKLYSFLWPFPESYIYTNYRCFYAACIALLIHFFLFLHLSWLSLLLCNLRTLFFHNSCLIAKSIELQELYSVVQLITVAKITDLLLLCIQVSSFFKSEIKIQKKLRLDCNLNYPNLGTNVWDF